MGVNYNEKQLFELQLLCISFQLNHNYILFDSEMLLSKLHFFMNIINQIILNVLSFQKSINKIFYNVLHMY